MWRVYMLYCRGRTGRLQAALLLLPFKLVGPFATGRNKNDPKVFSIPLHRYSYNTPSNLTTAAKPVYTLNYINTHWSRVRCGIVDLR